MAYLKILQRPDQFAALANDPTRDQVMDISSTWLLQDSQHAVPLRPI